MMKSLIWVLLALIWFAFLGWGTDSLPALGRVLEVHAGVWQHNSQSLQSQDLPGLKKEVLITIDRSGVPHVFAESEQDLYRAQGFLTASQRLFQLDIHTRQTAGRLSEVFGSRTKAFDDFFIRFGMRQAARRTWEEYSKDSEIAMMVESYVEGVNSYVSRLQELPPEYKILGQEPKKFVPLDVINMGKALTWSLAGRSLEPQLTQHLQKLGVKKVLDLFPEYLPSRYEDFVFPEHLGKPHAPEKPESFTFVSSLTQVPSFPLPNPGRGSNNWAVGPVKSERGKSLLANDTHLTLTLPNIWYELQLSCPEFNVYGVSLVAIPGVVNGLNRDIAWGPTNGTTDVLDFYEVEFQDEKSLRYKWKEGWKEARVEKEWIENKFFTPTEVDVVETEMGMLLHREGRLGLVADWTGYRPGRELKALRKQWAAQTAKECMANFSDWLSPIQNFICIDRSNIGWVHAGFVPKRQSGEGRFFRDGRGSQERLTKAVDKVPQSLNPKQGYLLSANQKIVPSDYPDYLGWDYEPPFRGMTIRRYLKNKEKLSPQDIMDLQNQNIDLQAEMALPLLLRHSRLVSNQSWLARFRSWDFRIRAEQPEAALFKAWWVALKQEIFADDLGTEDKTLMPKDARVIWMLDKLSKNPNDPDVRWVDNISTPAKVETLEDLVAAAFEKAIKRLESEQGTDQRNWSWKEWNKTHFVHVARLPGFGTPTLAMNGSLDSVRGQGATHGAVYKAVVATGEWPEAWMQVPGGNEGDPFSVEYERYVQDWADGKMRKVEFYRNKEEALAQAERVIRLTPKRIAP